DDDRARQDSVSPGGHRGLLTRAGDVEGAVEPGVDRTPPAACRALLDFEVERLVVGIDHDVEVAIAPGCAVQAIGHAVRFVRQVDLRPDAIPADIVAPEAQAAEARMRLTEGDHPLREAMMVGIPSEARPVDP